jgi:hypothetical protein
MAGFIHSKLDIKLLVLYLTSRLAGPVDFATLTDLTLCDDGADYFQVAEVISELVESGHLTLSGELYQITDKGRRNIADGESSLSPVIRKRCDQRLAPLNNAIKRSAQVRTEMRQTQENSWQVRLMLDDESDNLFSLSLLAPSEETGKRIADGFRTHPERIYNGILGILLDEHRSDPT